MSRRPFMGDRIMRLFPTSYAAGAPVSAYRALTTRSNLQFLIDESAQHRINYVAATIALETQVDGLYIDRGGDTAYTFKWAQEFELTWLRPDYPCGFDLLVAALVGATGGDDLALVVRVVPYFAPYYDPTYPAIFTGTASTTGANTTCVIEDQIQMTTTMDQSDQILVHSTEEDGFVVSPRQMVCRLEIEMTVPADDTGLVSEIMLREFACQS